eukprot:364848-Chlamydomonas_euryale.AAC.12
MDPSTSATEQPQRRLVGAMHALPCIHVHVLPCMPVSNLLHPSLASIPQCSCAASSSGSA